MLKNERFASTKIGIRIFQGGGVEEVKSEFREKLVAGNDASYVTKWGSKI